MADRYASNGHWKAAVPHNLKVYRLVGCKVKPCRTMGDWIRIYDDIKRDDNAWNGRCVANSIVSDDVTVSTVFLGLDHAFGNSPPILFETLILGGALNQTEQRYETWQQAIEGHAKWLGKAIKAEYHGSHGTKATKRKAKRQTPDRKPRSRSHLRLPRVRIANRRSKDSKRTASAV